MPRKAGNLTGDPSFKQSKNVAQVIADGVKSQFVVDESTQTTEEHNQRIDEGARERLKERFADTNGTTNTNSTTNNSTNSTGTVASSGSGLNGYLSPGTVQHGIQLPKFDVNGAIGTNLYSSASSIPETSIQDATRHRRTIARQSNSLDVALDKTARDRKAIKLATELRHLEGDAVDYHTAGIQIATKVVKNQVADRDYKIEGSKLEQKNALLEQQQIATAGTQALTPLIKEEWNLKVEQQRMKNENLKVDIEKGQADINLKRIELETKLIEAAV